MRESRLFKLVYLLLSDGTVTAAELAKRFEVSQRTIYRDIDMLSAAGIPIQTTQGKGGGVSLLPGFVLDRLLVSKDEQRELISALQSLCAAGQPEAEALMDKLRALFPDQRADWIEVDFTRWGSDEAERRRFTQLRDAILGRRVIAFDYRDMYGRTTSRRTLPAKLVFKQSAWYLQAYCLSRGDYRTFKVSRISGLTITDEVYDRQLTPPPVEWLDPAVSTTPVTLRFAPTAASRVYDEMEDVTITQLPTGELLVDTRMADIEWILGYLMTYGSAVTIVSPPELNEAFRQEVTKMYQKFS